MWKLRESHRSAPKKSNRSESARVYVIVMLLLRQRLLHGMDIISRNLSPGAQTHTQQQQFTNINDIEQIIARADQSLP